MKDLTPPGLFTNSSASYALTLYPTGDFFNVYSTNNPWIASLGVAVVMVLTSVLFVLYNNLMRREFHAEQALLQAKRQFMRYISHEVRTPLNATCTGLTLLIEEVEGYLGADHPKTQSNTEKAAQYWLELVKDIHSSAVRDCVLGQIRYCSPKLTPFPSVYLLAEQRGRFE